MRTVLGFSLFTLSVVVAACQTSSVEPDWRAELEQHRAERNQNLSSENPVSRFSLVHREYLGDRKEITFGTSPDADIRLLDDSLAPLHARFETRTDPPRIHEVHPDWKESRGPHWEPGDPPEFFSMTELGESNTFGVGRYAVTFRPDAPVHGDALEIFDTKEPAVLEFEGIDFYPIDPKWRVTGTVIPADEPKEIILVDSHGQDRPYFIYGDLNFRLEGKDLTLKLYSHTLDLAEIREDGFQLMFTDETSGGELNETYPAGRYLTVDGQASGAVTVDFNRAYNPPCGFSPVYTCPFPRKENRLAVAVRAGEKKYAGKVAEPLMQNNSE